MFVLGVYLHVLMILCISLEAQGLTADIVFSMLNNRLNSLEIVTFSLEASVKSINERLNNIETLSEAQQQINVNTVAESKEVNVKSGAKSMKRIMMKAFASEKMFINNAFSEYEGKFAELQKTVKDEIDLMNKTFKALCAHLERRDEEKVTSIDGKFAEFQEPVNDHMNNTTEASSAHLERRIEENVAIIDEKFAEFHKTVKDEMDMMNNTFEASSAYLERRIEENVASIEASNVYFEKTIKENEANMNSSLLQLTMDSEIKLQDAIFQFEVAITNASTEHEATEYKINVIEKSVSDMEGTINWHSYSIDSVDTRVSSLQSQLGTLDSEVSSQHRSQERDISSVQRRVSSLEEKSGSKTCKIYGNLYKGYELRCQ